MRTYLPWTQLAIRQERFLQGFGRFGSFFYFQTNPTQMQNKKVLVVLNTVKSRTFYKINLLMVFIKQAGGSNLDILRKLA